jgi:PREDICTED: death-associated protein kinase 1-like
LFRVRGGELFDFISDSDGLSESETIELLKQILLGLKHMHKKNIVHLDLKPENIMLLEKNTKSLKLIDFGLSRVVNSDSDIREIMGTPEFVGNLRKKQIWQCIFIFNQKNFLFLCLYLKIISSST